MFRPGNRAHDSGRIPFVLNRCVDHARDARMLCAPPVHVTLCGDVFVLHDQHGRGR
ncbi:hypothetical protein SGM_0998 [Streptomyces griseoaurantiacus M045]|uniref:Uncharacterized protein n=1 Tax=Streptomyces griseoaurantiacus M045 TaxID=996637 RepID=F3NCY4_9ACTN|nr:hypothetical protein SGM_0998 [Streptomyces griseoaurantiacus M045]